MCDVIEMGAQINAPTAESDVARRFGTVIHRASMATLKRQMVDNVVSKILRFHDPVSSER